MKQTPSPYIKEVKVVRQVRSTYVWFSPRYAMPFAALLVVILGTGTAYASQAALPGDALYTIKVNVTEPAVGALAIGDEAKAQWNAQVAQTRLEEAETLASQGKLDATTSDELTQNFDDHSKQAAALAQKVEDEDPGSGVELAEQFDSSLAAHDAILARVGNDSTSSKQFTDDVSEHVREHGSITLALATASDSDNQDNSSGSEGDNASPVAKTMSVQTFSAVAPTAASTSTSTSAKIQATTTTKVSVRTAAQIKAIAKLKKSAASALSDAKDAFNASKQSLGATTTLKIQSELTRIGVAVDAATSTASLTGALKDATVLKAFLKASKNLNVNLFSGIRFGNQSSNNSQNNKGPDTAATSTPANSPDITSGAQIQAQIQPDNSGKGSSDSSGGDNGGDQGKGSDEDSFVHHLLNNN